MLCNICIYVRQVKSFKYAETPWTGENFSPSAVLSCEHTLSSSVFSHCLRVIRQKKQTANTKFNKTSLFSWTSVSEDIIIHSSGFHLSLSLLSQNQSYSNNRWSTGTMNFIWSLSGSHDTFIRRKVRNTKQGDVFTTWKFTTFLMNFKKFIHSLSTCSPEHDTSPIKPLWSWSKSVKQRTRPYTTGTRAALSHTGKGLLVMYRCDADGWSLAYTPHSG